MARLDTFDRELKLMIADTLSPEARARAFGEEARKIIVAQDDANDRAAGRDVQFKTYVDGRASGVLESAQRVILAEWDIIETALRAVHAMLTDKAPVLKGDYRRSITLFADGIAVPVEGAIPDAEEYFFAATVPYARKIEKGLSRQAPDGVFEAVAALAKKRFGNVAIVRFGYRSVTTGGAFTPYVPVIRPSMRRKRAGSNAATRAAAKAERGERQPAIIILPR